MKELIEKYGISETVTVEEREFFVLNIPMMTDERWQELARENAIHNFTVQNGREPECVEEAVRWQRAFIAELEKREERGRGYVCTDKDFL